ncbi:MAG TPA: hypothetical protein ENG03_10355 [Thioploca sp.]|nr:hypothetical protein [Thioploca sp.]
MTNIFTVFCHGTGEHRAKNNDDELIHYLSGIVNGTEYNDLLIFDGPGTGYGDVENPTPRCF